MVGSVKIAWLPNSVKMVDSLASSKCLEMCILWLLDLQMVGSVKIAWLPVNV